MKLILFVLSLSLVSHAQIAPQNWMRIADIKAGITKGFQLEKDCLVQGPCVNVPDGDASVYVEKKTIVDGQEVVTFEPDPAKVLARDNALLLLKQTEDARRLELDTLKAKVKALELNSSSTAAQVRAALIEVVALLKTVN